MELLYVWIEDYNNIKRQGFNFSPKHHFHFEPNEKEGPVTGGTLTHNPINPNYPDNFFGEHISNITAIVGKNGSGKSSLIKFILEGNYKDFKYIFLYMKDKSIVCKCTNIKYINCFESYLEGNISKFRKSIIYFSPLITSNSNFIIQNDFKNISTVEMLYESTNILSDKNRIYSIGVMANRAYHPIMATYSMLEMSKQIKFVNQIKNFKHVPFTLPQNIEISITLKKSRISSGKEKSQEKQILVELLRLLVEKEKRKDWNLDSRDYDFYSQIDEEIIGLCMDLGIREDARDEILSFFEFLSTNKLTIKAFENEISAIWEVERSKIFKQILNRNKSKSWNEWINMLGISFIWRDMSDGEAALLSLMARLWEYIEEKKDASRINKYTHIIILDEFEVGFHPEWQKEAINRLVAFLNLFEINFQLIITTHSPIILSDIPSNSVIYLEKDEHTNRCNEIIPEDIKRTFGANIHNLYRSSFFMQDGLMGKFAKEKIDGVIRDLRGDGEIEEKRKTEIRFIIDTIGEDVLRTGLEKLYEGRFPLSDKERLEKEFIHLEKKKAEVEQKLKALN
jgi:predicted ATP-dependent endonuclease of OLD family